MKKQLVYMLESHGGVRDHVESVLKNAGMDFEGFETPKAFREAVKIKQPDMVLLALMLTEEDGISVLRWLRRQHTTDMIPVIILSARSSEYDKVEGLDAGADDYITKPFGNMELVSRIRAVLRRTAGCKNCAAEKKHRDYFARGLRFSPDRHQLVCGDREVAISQKEFDLLCMFFENPGFALSRDKLLRGVWGYEFDGESRTVDVHINGLRQKLAGTGAVIETVRGCGYKLTIE